MREEFGRYLDSLIYDVPYQVYEGMLSVFCLCTALIIAYKKKELLRALSRLLLTEYYFLVLCSTFFFRIQCNERFFEFTPFWSYKTSNFLVENSLNVVIFVPIGILIGCAYKNNSWWKTIIIGVFLSVVIESLQFLYKRGFSEFDDVIHNTLGCMIGYGIYVLLVAGCTRITKRSTVDI